MKIDVLDKGHVEVVEHMGSDLTVANAARVSFATHKDELDNNNIPYLVTSALRFGGNTGAGPHGYGIAVDFSNLYQLVDFSE